MGNMQKTAIIIPCYNEANRLDCPEFLRFTRENEHISFIMVNDGSTDGTADLLNELCRQNPKQLFVVNCTENKGKAEAVRIGFQEAFKRDFNIIGYWDADLATPLYEINNLGHYLESLNKNMAFASRVRLLSRKIARNPYRHYLGRIFATLASIVLRLTIYDTQCGAKLFRNTSDLRAVFSKAFMVNWIFDIEIIARFILLKKLNNSGSIEDEAIEYPLLEWQDIPGSKLRMADFLKAIIELLKIANFIHAPNWRARGAALFCSESKQD